MAPITLILAPDRWTDIIFWTRLYGAVISPSPSHLHDMSTNDLFSFLEDGETADDVEMADVPAPSAPPRKRKAREPAEKHDGAQGGAMQVDLGEEPSAVKKPRTTSPGPVVLDDFETEAKREVAPSAGLTGGPAETAPVQLGHMVRERKPLISLQMLISLDRSDTKWPSPQVITISPSLSMFPPQSQIANTSSSSTPSSVSPSTPSSGMRAS